MSENYRPRSQKTQRNHYGVREEGREERSYGFKKERYGHEGPAREGFKKEGFKRDGFKKEGFKKEGFKKEGFKKEGFRGEGFKGEGFRKEGFKKEGFRKDFHQDGFHKDGFKKDGFRKDFHKDRFRREESAAANVGIYENGEEREFRRDGYKRPYKKDGFKKPYARDGYKKDFRPKYKKERVEEAPKDEVRLNKFIANAGFCSRREADTYIAAGVVTVNGEPVTAMGFRVTSKDDVRFNGERVTGEQKVYLVMNKPKDYVTTVSDPHAEHTVMELISKELCPQRVYPVGRLDRNTTGVLLFTNDGELTKTLTHPSFNRKKIYQVNLDKNLKPDHFEQLLMGVELEDGEAHADQLSYLDGDDSCLGIEIHSGRNRIVRRMFEALGYEVKKLDRVYFAGMTKKNLKRGQWRFLTEQEVSMLKMGAYE